MRQLPKTGVRAGIGRALRNTAAAALCCAALCQPNFAYAAHGGGGGFHGGGGGFHGGGFHGGWHGAFAGVHNRVGNGGHWYHGWHGGRYGWWLAGPGLAWTYYEYPWWGYYPDYGYNGYYDYSQPYASQTWYYCSDPAGYYPYVTQCNTGWQAVPAS
ncbi:MAG: hypothetical protein WA633_25150 [Stellaceae bacterium]